MTRLVQAACVSGALVLLLVATGLVVEASSRIPDVSAVTRDPTAVAGVPWWTGALSRLTNLCWAAAAALNFLAAQAAVTRHRLPLLLLAGLGAVLGIDDTMLLHESVLPAGELPEQPLLALDAVAALVLAVLWRRVPWRRSNVTAFLAGAALLAVAVASDVLHTVPLLVEDGAKLGGILAWCFCGFWAHADMLATPRDAPVLRS